MCVKASTAASSSAICPVVVEAVVEQTTKATRVEFEGSSVVRRRTWAVFAVNDCENASATKSSSLNCPDTRSDLSTVAITTTEPETRSGSKRRMLFA